MVEGGVKYHQTKNKKKQFIAWILELFKQLGIFRLSFYQVFSTCG
jgi:hypothetical protein